jgi:uncharacterized protein (DUF2147 family)
MRRPLIIASVLAMCCVAGRGWAIDSPTGTWRTVDDKTGKMQSQVQLYEERGKLFGKITSLAEPLGPDGKPKICVKCAGSDKDAPIIGLVIIKDLAPSGDRYKGGTILDPEDGKIYKAEIWVEDGKLKVRGYMGPFYRTQTWLKGS